MPFFNLQNVCQQICLPLQAQEVNSKELQWTELRLYLNVSWKALVSVSITPPSCLKHLKIPNAKLHSHRSQRRGQEPFLARLIIMPKFLKPGCTGRATWDSITAVLVFADHCFQDCEMRSASLVSICHSLAPPGCKAETSNCLGKISVDWPSTALQHPEYTTKIHVDARHPGAVGLPPLRLLVLPTSLLLGTTLYFLGREITRSRWRQGQSTQHLACCHIMVWCWWWLFSWNHSAPRAGSSQPPQASESWELSDRPHSYACAQLCLPSNAVVISLKKETQL